MGNKPFIFGSRESGENLILLFALTLILIVGTVGYHTLEGWSYFDSMYMTVITLSTVGFGEVHELSEYGRWLTIFLIVAGVGVAMLLLTSAANKILERELRWVWKGGHMLDEIDNTTNHTIFCGFGRLAQAAIADLQESKEIIVVIDADEDRVNLAREHGLLALLGDATQDETLRTAGIQRADKLVSLLPKDADNLYVILAARELNPDIFSFTRAEYSAGEKRLKQAGANKVISPYRVGGQKIADGLVRPHVLDFLELAASGTHEELFIEEIAVPAESPVNGKMLKDSNLRSGSNIIIAAIITPQGQTIFNPSGNTKISGGTTLIAMGCRNDFDNIESLLLP